MRPSIFETILVVSVLLAALLRYSGYSVNLHDVMHSVFPPDPHAQAPAESYEEYKKQEGAHRLKHADELRRHDSGERAPAAERERIPLSATPPSLKVQVGILRREDESCGPASKHAIGFGDVATIRFNITIADPDDRRKELMPLVSGFMAARGDREKLRNMEPGKLVEFSGPYFHRLTVGDSALMGGVDEGLLGACRGERRKLRIPSVKAFASTGDVGLGIPPDSDVIFRVDVLGINLGEKEASALEEAYAASSASVGGGQHREPEKTAEQLEAEQLDRELKEMDANLFEPETVPKRFTDLTLESFKALAEGGTDSSRPRHIVIFFYSMDCAFCSDFKFIYDKLGDAYRSLPNEEVLIAGAQQGVADSLFEQFGVDAYPTVLQYTVGTGERAKFEGERTQERLFDWVKDVTGISPS